MWYVICAVGGAIFGTVIGIFFASAGRQNKEWDAFNEGYRKAIEDIETGKKVLK